MSAVRKRSRAVKSVTPRRYVQAAVIEIARIRSSVSGSVVYASRGKPENAESVVFRRLRFVNPDVTPGPSASCVITVVHSSAPA